MRRAWILLGFLAACGDDAAATAPDCSVCSEHASCVAAPAGVVCACADGFAGDGWTCRDLDECTLAIDACHPHASCTNLVGSYTCACQPGFTGDGTTCDDVDECAAGAALCPGELTCLDLPGDHACVCPLGQQRRGDGCFVADQLTVGGPLDTSPIQASPCAFVDGRLVCWGAFPALGQPPLGDAPIAWTTISMGAKHACGLDDVGQAWCAGDDDTGALGRGAQGIERFYLAPDEVLGDHVFGQIRAGGRSSCAIDLDRHLWCWGQPFAEKDRSFLPAQVDDEEWLEVGVGDYFSCGLHVDGTLWCWGDYAYGTPSAGQVQLPLVPEQVGHGRWRTVAVGEATACAIAHDDGSLWCWGGNTAGAAGAGVSEQLFWPTLIDDGSWLTAEVGMFHACAIAYDGSLWCWGFNHVGQLGTGNLEATSRPVQVGSDLDWIDVSVAAFATCARKRDESVWCTGSSAYGETGRIAETELLSPTYPELGNFGWTSLSAGRTGTCGFNRVVSCWGQTGQFARDDFRSPVPNAIFQQPSAVPPLDTTVVTSDGETCWLREGRLWCFGVETFPAEIESSGAKSLIGGSYRFADSDIVCLLGEDHQVSCEGEGPAPVVPAGTWETVSLAPDHGCGIDTAGLLSCWGANQAGQLGDGTFVDRATPVPTGGSGAWRDVQVSDSGGCALDDGGFLWCWPGAEPIPSELGDGAVWFNLSVGAAHACAIREDRRLFCWGDNQWGQLGTGNKLSRPTPAPITDLTWSLVSAGVTHTCAADSDSWLLCWGTGYLGFLTDETASTDRLNRVFP